MSDFKQIMADYDKLAEKGATKPEVEVWLASKGLTFDQFLTRVGRDAKAKGKEVRAGFGRMLAQGLSLGFADEAEAWVKSLNGADYDSTLQAIRNGLEVYREENPTSAFVAEMTGAALPTVGALIAAPFTGGGSAAVVAPTLGRLAARGAVTGGSTGFASGFGASEGNLENRLKGGALGGTIGTVTGGALPVATTATKNVYQALRPIFSKRSQREIVGDALNEVATNPAAARANLRSAEEIVPGSMPTTSQAARDPGLAAAQTPIRSAYDIDNRIGARLSEQNTARQDVLGRISGDTPETIAYARAKRDAVTGPMRENAFDSSVIADQIIPSGYTLTVTQKIADILKSPAGKRKTVQAALNDASKRIKEADNIRDLYEIRKDLRLASMGKLSGPRQDYRVAKKELEQVIREVDNVIESAAPGYRAYLNRYSTMSRPIDQMTALQQLRERASLAGPDVMTGQNVLSQPKMRSQMRSDQLDVLSPSQTRQLGQIMRDLDRSVAPTSANVRVPGSETAKNITVQGVLNRILGNPNSSLARTLSDKFSWMYRMPEKRIEALLIDAMLDPRLASDIMGEASESALESVSKALRSRARLTGASATAGTASGLLSN